MPPWWILLKISKKAFTAEDFLEIISRWNFTEIYLPGRAPDWGCGSESISWKFQSTTPRLYTEDTIKKNLSSTLKLKWIIWRQFFERHRQVQYRTGNCARDEFNATLPTSWWGRLCYMPQICFTAFGCPCQPVTDQYHFFKRSMLQVMLQLVGRCVL